MTNRYIITLPDGYYFVPVDDTAPEYIKEARLIVANEALDTESSIGWLHPSIRVEKVDPTPPNPNPTPQPVLVVYEVIATNGLKVRSTPVIPDNPNGNKIGLIARGKRLTIDSAAPTPLANGWVWAQIQSTEYMGAWVALRSVDGDTVLASKVEVGA